MLKAQLVPQSDYSGGLNTSDNPLSLQDNETPDCVNVRPGLFRSVQRRDGKTKLNTSVVEGASSSINALHDFALTDSNHILTCVADANLFKMDSFDGTWDAITDTVGLNNARCELRNFYAGANKLVITCYNAVNIQSWDGSSGSTDTISGAAAFKYQWPDENTGRLWAAGLASNEPIAFFTPIATLTFDTTNDKIQIATDGSDVVGFRSLKGVLYSWTTTGVFKINDLGGGTGNARFGVKRVTDSKGTRSPQSLANINLLGIGEGIIYLDTSRQLQFFDGFNTTPISLKFNRRSSISSAHSLDRISAANLEDVHAVQYAPWDSYVLFYKEDSDTAVKNAIAYNYILKSGWPMEGITANASTVAIDSGTEKWFIGGTTGFVWQQDSGNDDDGTTIPSNYTWNRKTPTKGAQVKFRQSNLTVKPTVSGATLAVSARVDFDSSFEALHNIDLTPEGDLLGTTFILGTSTLGTTEAAIAPIRIDRVGKLLQMKIQDNSSNAAWQLFGDELALTPIGIH